MENTAYAQLLTKLKRHKNERLADLYPFFIFVLEVSRRKLQNLKSESWPKTSSGYK